MIIIETIDSPFADWCFTNQIYFYGFTDGCDTGFCKIVKWVNGEPTFGTKIFPIINIKFTLKSLYEQVYKQSNH